MNAPLRSLATLHRSLKRYPLNRDFSFAYIASATIPALISRTTARPLHSSSTSSGAPGPDDKPAISGKRTAAGTATMAPSSHPPHTPILSYSKHDKPPPPSPSASVILINPSNKILLVHRLKTSSAFPSAHVFPGGNLEKSDGELPSDPTDVGRHLDSIVYRTGAIRELFEESGILLARKGRDNSALLEVSAQDRLRGRKVVHDGKIAFGDWLSGQANRQAVLDTEALIPFTHWVTPPNVPKRFTTQMYVYFVPLSERGNESVEAAADEIETMAAEWRSARDWLGRSRRGEIILFPPQFMLLYLISEFLDAGVKKTGNASGLYDQDIEERRAKLKNFIETDSSPPWKDKFISPIGMKSNLPDGRNVLDLRSPGPELKDSGFRGETDRVVLVKFKKEGPREVEVGWRKDVPEAQEEKQKGSKL